MGEATAAPEASEATKYKLFATVRKVATIVDIQSAALSIIQYRNGMRQPIRVGLLLRLFLAAVATLHMNVNAFRPVISKRANPVLDHPSRVNNIDDGVRSQSILQLSKRGDDDNKSGENLNDSSSTLLDRIGLMAQPVVWISLYSVATTGGGLPAGPFGLVGAVEGLAYVVVVGFVASSLVSRSPSLKLVESLSWLTVGSGIFTLLVLVAQQGCVPNAKPILDYSAYVPVCDPNETPGFFGG